ncbi:hypothetical protein IGI04_003518, partial [Brassica rapa subsp. trilocularis]
MGQDYSYTQPSSSAESLDMTYLLEAECELYKDEDDSRILHQLSKQKVLERLLGKKEPLTEMETSLQLKLMAE